MRKVTEFQTVILIRARIREKFEETQNRSLTKRCGLGVNNHLSSANEQREPLVYSAVGGIRFTGGSPRATRWMFSAMTFARTSSIPSVQPDACGVMSTFGNSWNA